MINDTKLQSIGEYIKIHNSNTEAQLRATKSLSGLLLLKFEPIPLKSQSTLEFEAFNVFNQRDFIKIECFPKYTQITFGLSGATFFIDYKKGEVQLSDFVAMRFLQCIPGYFIHIDLNKIISFINNKIRIYSSLDIDNSILYVL